MMATTAIENETTGPAMRPNSLRDAPSLIERLWPAQKISAEAQKERKAVQSQTLTALGSYWKGRKPLVLVRACVLGALLPATADAAEDLAIFEALMRIDDDAFFYRDKSMKAAEIAQRLLSQRSATPATIRECFVERDGELSPDDESLAIQVAKGRLMWRKGVSEAERSRLTVRALSQIPYLDRVSRADRPEDLGPTAYASIWSRVNVHLGTRAASMQQLVDQLGTMRFGRRPVVADPFAGAGSIPFEAARMGCDVFASDLNPVACMLSWGALDLVGQTEAERASLVQIQAAIVDQVQQEIDGLGIEEDEEGNRAKAFLYCIEARCP